MNSISINQIIFTDNDFRKTIENTESVLLDEYFDICRSDISEYRNNVFGCDWKTISTRLISKDPDWNF